MSGHFNQIFGKYDDAFRKARSEEYKLSILLSQNGFSFVLFYIERNFFSGLASFEYKGLKKTSNYCSAFREFAESNEYLTLKYNEVTIIYESPNTTLIPTPLFIKNEKEQYLKFNSWKKTEDIVLIDNLINLEANNVFSIPIDINKMLNNLFPGSKTHCHISALIENIMIVNKNLPLKMRVFVNVRKDLFDIIITEGSSLIYHNTFPHKSNEDFIFYILYVFNQFKINPEDIDFSFSGLIDNDSKLFEIAYKYIRNISFEKLNDAFSYSYAIKEIPEHYFLNLINSNRCEL